MSELEQPRRGLAVVHRRERVDTSAQGQLAFLTSEAVLSVLAGNPNPNDDASLAAIGSEPADPGGCRGGKPAGKPKKNITPHGRGKLPPHLPVEAIVIRPPASEIKGKVHIGDDVSEILERKRVSYVRVRIVRPKYIDPNVPEAGILVADAPLRPYPRALMGPELLAYVLFANCGEPRP